MKFGQLIEYPKTKFFLKNYTKNEARKLVPDGFLFLFLKSFILGKSKQSAAWFHYISIALKLAYYRNKLFKTLRYWSRDMLNFDFFDKRLEIVSPPNFEYDFSTKLFHILYSISWPNFIVWLPLLLEILDNMCISIVC